MHWSYSSLGLSHQHVNHANVTLNVQGWNCFHLTMSTSWLLMPWLRAFRNHQYRNQCVKSMRWKDIKCKNKFVFALKMYQHHIINYINSDWYHWNWNWNWDYLNWNWIGIDIIANQWNWNWNWNFLKSGIGIGIELKKRNWTQACLAHMMRAYYRHRWFSLQR